MGAAEYWIGKNEIDGSIGTKWVEATFLILQTMLMLTH